MTSNPTKDRSMVSSTTVQKIQNSFLTCPVCYEIYDQPKCLPCLHTLCYLCLGSYIETQESYGAKRKKGFPCPICKQFVFVKSWTKPPSEWADDIQDNFLIKNMIESLIPESQSTSSAPESNSLSSGNTMCTSSSSTDPIASVPRLETEIDSLMVPHRALPSAPPMNPSSGTTRTLTFPGAHYDIRLRRYVPVDPISDGDRSTGDVLNTGYHLAPEVIRPSRSTVDLTARLCLAPMTNNLFRNRSNSSSDLNARETVVLFTETSVPWRCVYKPNFYCRKPGFSDVCCLPKRSSIVATDYNNRKVVLCKDLFHRTCSFKKVKVKGRPCSIALLDEESENCVVVNLQNKGILIFISVPDMEILRQVNTCCNYRSAAVLSPDTLIVGNSDRPASIDLIKIDQDYNISPRQVLIENGAAWDLSSPDHICVLSPTSFMVSDSGRKSLICYDIVEDRVSKTKRAVKRFSLMPRADRKFRCPGGLFFDRSSQSVYTVDYGHHSVLQVVLRDTLFCETVLTGENNVYRPASVCLGPQNQLCVVDWEGHISLYEQTVS